MNERPVFRDSTAIRPAGPADAAVLGAMRAAQQIEIDGPQPDGAFETYERRCIAFFARELSTPAPWVLAWVAEESGISVGSVVLTTSPGMPRLGSAADGPDGRIRNVYVRADARRRGIARALTRVAIDAAERLGVSRLMLGASPMGRPLYVELGFVDKGDEMVYRPRAVAGEA